MNGKAADHAPADSLRQAQADLLAAGRGGARRLLIRSRMAHARDAPHVAPPLETPAMSGFLYYLLTFAEGVTSVFGIRGVYEQPRYAVIQGLGQNAEIRCYEPRVAIEATIDGGDRQQAAGQAFNLLFRYITGANQASGKIAMTAPVSSRTTPERIAMTVPVQTGGIAPLSMRFFLPRDVVEHGAPLPTDPRLRLVQVPESTIAALRYTGVDNERMHDEKAAQLLALLKSTPWHPVGEAFRLNYDPPFAIPFLRRNEAAVAVAR